MFYRNTAYETLKRGGEMQSERLKSLAESQGLPNTAPIVFLKCPRRRSAALKETSEPSAWILFLQDIENIDVVLVINLEVACSPSWGDKVDRHKPYTLRSSKWAQCVIDASQVWK